MPTFERILRNKKIIFLDLDGTVYMGDNLIPGARAFMQYLEDQNIHYYFLSNNSSRSKKDYVEKLTRLSLTASEEDIILSTDGTIDFLLRQSVKEVYVVGSRSMRQMFQDAGFKVESTDPEYVVLGFDTELTYEKLKIAAIFLNNGVELLATHPDFVCPTPEGPIPDVGAILALFEKSCGKKPFRIFGKPNPEMVSHILSKHQVSPQEVVMIGDRIYTDMEFAHRLNCDSILVLSGEAKQEDLEKMKHPPTLVVESIGHIISSINL